MYVMCKYLLKSFQRKFNKHLLDRFIYPVFTQISNLFIRQNWTVCYKVLKLNNLNGYIDCVEK